MKKKAMFVPPLRKVDILTLRGKPGYKLVKKNQNPSLSKHQADQEFEEEWVYLRGKNEEHFVFYGQQLIDWNTKPIMIDGL